jgi:hypothetical protein
LKSTLCYHPYYCNGHLICQVVPSLLFSFFLFLIWNKNNEIKKRLQAVLFVVCGLPSAPSAWIGHRPGSRHFDDVVGVWRCYYINCMMDDKSNNEKNNFVFVFPFLYFSIQ